MKTLTLDLYTVARGHMRFDGYDPRDTARRVVDNMAHERYRREREALGPLNEFDAHAAIVRGDA